MKFTFLQKFCDILRKKAVLAHYFKGKYDTVFSLGNNCELCIRLRDDFLGANFESFLFNWTAILDRDKFLELLTGNIKALINDDFEFLNTNDMFYAKYFKIGIHSRYKMEDLVNNPKLQKEALDEIKSRLNHLIDKTENLFNSNNSILFIAKILHKSFKDDCNYIRELTKFIQNLPNAKKRKLKLLCIVQKEDYGNENFKRLCLSFNEFEKSRFEIKRIKKFADLGMKNGDRRGWIKVLKKEIFI